MVVRTAFFPLFFQNSCSIQQIANFSIAKVFIVVAHISFIGLIVFFLALPLTKIHAVRLRGCKSNVGQWLHFYSAL